MDPRWRNRLFNGLLLCFSIVAALIVGEALVRLKMEAWPFDYEAVSLPYMTEEDSILRWRTPPGAGRNSLGLRDQEITDKDANTFRILILGDSLVYRGDTTSGDLWTEVAEQKINSALQQSGYTFDVVNAGVRGYTTFQELQFLKIYGLEMDPDLVVLAFVFNDLHYKYLHRPTERGWLDMEPESALTLFDTESFPGYLFAQSYLVHAVVYAYEILRRRLGGDVVFEFDNRRDFHLAWKSYGWRKTEELIGEMDELLESHGIDFTVVVFPVSEQVDPNLRRIDEGRLDYPNRRIMEICRSRKLACFDLSGALLEGGGNELFADYLHLTGEGNDIVAEQVAAFLLRSGLLNGRGANAANLPTQ